MNATTIPGSTATGTTGTVMAGLGGGLAAGTVFGMVMQAMGMIGMVAQLVGSSSTGAGWLVHLAVSAGLGAGFTLVTAGRLASLGMAVGLGVGYGLLWWALGALLLMPARLGMPVLQLDATAWKSLMGHMMYGAILGLVASVLVRRSPAR